MIAEVLGGVCFALILFRFYTTNQTKPVHMEYARSFGNHSNFDSFFNAYTAMKQNLRVFSEPMVKLFGFSIMNNYQILDPDLVRDFFMTDNAQSHDEMRGFFGLCFQYRELTGAKGAGRLSDKELGVMRDFDVANDPDGTAIAKLARKRFLEFTSSPAQAKVNLNRIRQEAESLIDVVLEESCNGTVPFDPKRLTLEAATNTGLATATGFSQRQGSPELRETTKWVNRSIFEVAAPYPSKLYFILMPKWLRQCIPLRYWPHFLADIGPFWDHVIALVDERKLNFDIDDPPQCLLDTMMRDHEVGLFTYSDMVCTVWALMVAASDTTSETTILIWLNMARFPEWQQKIYDEASSALFTAERLEDVPLVAAFILETVRYCPCQHRNLFHTTTVPVEVDGYKFNPGSIFSFSIASFMIDEKLFPEPFTFNPLRFVDENGKLKRNKNWMGFGYGRRSCPGKALAEQQLLQYTLAFLCHCEAMSDSNCPLPTTNTEAEWLEMFDQHLPVHGGSVMMPLLNRIMRVKRRVPM